MGISKSNAASKRERDSAFVAAGASARASDYISASVAAQRLGLSKRRVEYLCQIRVFKTSFKPGFGPNAHWRILRTEVVGHKFDGHLVQQTT